MLWSAKMDPLLEGGTDPFRVNHHVFKQDIEIFGDGTQWPDRQPTPPIIYYVDADVHR